MSGSRDDAPSLSSTGTFDDDLDEDELSAVLLHEVADTRPNGDAAAKSLGAQQLEELHFALVFEEPNYISMRYETHIRMRVTARTRFLERRYSWTGTGVQGRPRVTASSGGTTLSAVQHGPSWHESGFDAFLIDLGRTLDPGAELELQISQSLVDELGTLKPHLGHWVAHDYTKLKLSLEFLVPPDSCNATIEVLDASTGLKTVAWGPQQIAPRSEPTTGRTVFSYEPQAPSRGRHILEWNAPSGKIE